MGWGWGPGLLLQAWEAAGWGQDAWVPTLDAVLDDEAGVGETNWKGLDLRGFQRVLPLGWRVWDLPGQVGPSLSWYCPKNYPSHLWKGCWQTCGGASGRSKVPKWVVHLLGVSQRP